MQHSAGSWHSCGWQLTCNTQWNPATYQVYTCMTLALSYGSAPLMLVQKDYNSVWMDCVPGFPEHCIVMRWFMLFTSPDSPFNFLLCVLWLLCKTCLVVYWELLFFRPPFNSSKNWHDLRYFCQGNRTYKNVKFVNRQANISAHTENKVIQNKLIINTHFLCYKCSSCASPMKNTKLQSFHITVITAFLSMLLSPAVNQWNSMKQQACVLCH